MSGFRKIADQAVKYFLETSPVYATSMGHHEHDHLLDRLDPDFRGQRARKLQSFITNLEKHAAPPDGPPDDYIDWRVLTGSLQAELLVEEEHGRWQRDPSFPLELAMYGCYLLVLRDFAPAEHRAAAIAHRLRQVPRLLTDAKRNLANQPEIPKVWAEMGEELAEAGVQFFRGLGSSMAEKIPRISGDLVQSGKLASAACLDYHRFLKETIVNRSTGTFRFGAEAFDRLLILQHGLDYSGADLRSLGREMIAQTVAEMEKVAAQIDPDATVAELIDQFKQKTPPTKDLIAYYRAFVEGAHRHLVEKSLISVSKSIDLQLIDTPVFARSTYPYAGYMGAAPFDEDQQGFFWVTPIDASRPAEYQEQQKRGHNQYQALIVSLHEAYPGHHLQLQRANRLPANVRKLFGTAVFVEGWALYCEEMMFETGYYPDLQTRLMQLALQLWRACRVVIDVGLHDGSMSQEDAVGLLVDTAKLERVNAEAEVRRYTQSPTQPLSYMVGKMEIMNLREDYRKLRGDKFSLREFHDSLLSYGSIPVGLVRQQMLEQK